jgi:hypothetical protein
LFEQCANIRPQRKQQRPHDPDAPVEQHRIGNARHVGSRALPAHRERLALVVERVAGHDHVSAEFVCGLGKQPVSGIARRRHDPGLWLCAMPDLGDMRNIERPAESSDVARFIGRFGAQRVIDGRGTEGNSGIW